MEWVTLWRYEVVNKHHTEDSGKVTPPVCRHSSIPSKERLRIARSTRLSFCSFDEKKRH